MSNTGNTGNKGNTSSDFTEGSILNKLLKFMLPILGALILQAMYGAVDILVVGKFGTTSGISAVSTGSNIINMVTFTVAGLSMGVTVLIGRYLGEKRPELIGKLIGGAVCFFASLSIVLMIVLLTLARPIAILLQAPEEALDLTVTYVRICGGGIIFIISYNLISSIFRGMGNSRLPLIFVGIACVTNIIGDFVLIAIFNMNVAGAALATVTAQAVSVILSLIIIRRQKMPFTMTKKDVRFNSQIGKFVKLGLPIAFQEIMTQISFLALCAFINRLGLEASSGYGVANKIVSFVMLIPSSLMQSLAAFISQNVGAGLEKRAKKAMLCGMGVGAVVGVFVMMLVIFKGDLVSYIFSSDTAVIEKSAEYLKGFALEAVITSVLFSFMGYFNGHNRTLWVMIQGLAQTLLVRLPMSWFMSTRPDANLTMIGLAAPSATIFGIILNVIYYIIYTNKLKKEAAKIE
jgi:putative MATE family efflux protein